ncbi:hypothetical protein P7L87_23960 [Vibrio parahaemolyticus]|nr:hypothetical protein [Vibrio parahaemolyticus]
MNASFRLAPIEACRVAGMAKPSDNPHVMVSDIIDSIRANWPRLGTYEIAGRLGIHECRVANLLAWIRDGGQA